jgi:hypothetical protein
MAEVQFRLKGWMALPAILVVLGFLAFRTFTIRTTLASEATEELKVWLSSDYARLHLDGLDVKNLPKNGKDPRIQGLLELDKVEIVSIQARGTNPVYVKVEIRVAGKEPPDGRPTRYYLMEHSMVTGWRVKREISAFSYYMKLF